METISETQPKARKNHKCDYCNGDIKIGEVYNAQFNKCGGDTYTFKAHLNCLWLHRKLDMDGDEGVTDEVFDEYIYEYFTENFNYDEMAPLTTSEMAKMCYEKLKEGKNG